jgi:hypothetical protein
MSPAYGNTAASYESLVQQFYISYFGRPADPLGLRNFTEQLSAMQAPLDLGGVLTAMKTNPGLKTLINSFGTSDESTLLYGSDIIGFTSAIYTNVLNRAPDFDGLMFWAGEIQAGRLSKSAAALSIAEGAMTRAGDDAKILSIKNIISTKLTNSLDTSTELLAYVGNSAAVVARSLLMTVTVNTDPQTFDISHFLTGFPIFHPYSAPGETSGIAPVDGVEATLIGNAGLPAFDAPQAPVFA